MAHTVFQLIPVAGGWRLLDNGKPGLWFPEREAAMETARIMAEGRALFRGERACIQTKVGAEFVQVAAYG